MSSSNNTSPPPGGTASPPPSGVMVSFSHVQLYVDAVEDIECYKSLEEDLNHFASALHNDDNRQCAPSAGSSSSGDERLGRTLDVGRCQSIWVDIVDNSNPPENKNDDDDDGQQQQQRREVATGGNFIPQDRDVVKQLIAGFGFRVTGRRFPQDGSNTRSVLVTSCDPGGVQVVITAIDPKFLARQRGCGDDGDKSGGVVDGGEIDVDKYGHFDAANVQRFFEEHGNRQGVGVLSFQVTSGSIESIRQRYESLHPKLLKDFRRYDSKAVLEVYAYYRGEKHVTEADLGTVLRFIESHCPTATSKRSTLDCQIPGMIPVDATFDGMSSPAYCDHWVSNVISRTGFLDTLHDTLGFTPKVDFNAGVVAAGEAQIESTVTGNTSTFVTGNPDEALRDQSQVYLPINNALSSVGHVHLFLEELGQGIQHVASRVDDLPRFVQRANDYRRITGEGFTFLNIPRSYYGVLTEFHLMSPSNNDGKDPPISSQCARAIVLACESSQISTAGAVDLALTADELKKRLQRELMEERLDSDTIQEEFHMHEEWIIHQILLSRYINLYKLLRHHLTEKSYLDIVRNQILVDVQGEDLLFQIFTSNMLQRHPGEEAPFFEFIQRVCSECKSEDGCPAPVRLKPGCGGFGIRNFLTLFLSIEVSKAIMQGSIASSRGDTDKHDLAKRMVEIFTDQLNESNPILTEISDAMTAEGHARDEVDAALVRGDDVAAERWRVEREVQGRAKALGNERLMACSTKYREIMKKLREDAAALVA